MAGESILVVEDEEANLRLFTYLLSAKGYQVRGAADAQEAMELLGEFHSRIDLDGSAAPRHERVRHQDPYPGWVHGNTTVIIGEREVFVVDSTQFPSAAREDIAQIKQWTDKPVRYLLNTHWHADHFGGNREYLAAYPSVAIIAYRDTQPMADDFGRALPGLMLKSVAETRASC